MIPFEEAYQIVNSQTILSDTENIEFTNTLNRVLAENAVSDIDMPPFNKSAMDGFACRKEDLNSDLIVIETIAAGKIPDKSIGPNECSRIMTGAMIPQGADFVIMKEHIEELNNGKIRKIKDSSNENICYTGEDVKKGGIIVPKGTLIKPQHIAIMASAGIINPLVYKKPKVAIISTGNELVEPDIKPLTSQIRNSNSYQIIAQCMQLGITPKYLGIIEDNESKIYTVLSKAFDQYQVILISGGVSVGDYDLIPKILNQLHADILFHGTKAKPGKHLLFGRKNNCLVFGLPGNPVSSFIQFEILVKPLLLRIMGHAYTSCKLTMPLTCNYKRKKREVLEFIPVHISSNGKVTPVEYHGSAHISAYSTASGIMEIPIGINQINEGETVHVRPL